MAGILPVAFGIVKSSLSLVIEGFKIAFVLILSSWPYLLKYIELCIIVSLFVSIFMLGSFIGPVLGIMYFYYKVYQLYVCFDSNKAECL